MKDSADDLSVEGGSVSTGSRTKGASASQPINQCSHERVAGSHRVHDGDRNRRDARRTAAIDGEAAVRAFGHDSQRCATGNPVPRDFVRVAPRVQPRDVLVAGFNDVDPAEQRLEACPRTDRICHHRGERWGPN